ncbi:MAG TPA: DUF302 domain-containing protein [Gemmatimonadales bacterium]|nr:DUF302 domain-containing protein [Gemmatimonadales bacterium]
MTTALSTRYGFGRQLALPHGEAVAATKAVLATEGFGILAEIDVAATLRAKLGVEMEPYLILGACNPPLAHRALQAEPAIGLLLPCNVLVAADGPGASSVWAIDPETQFSLVDKPDLAPVAAEVKARLARALDALPTP